MTNSHSARPRRRRWHLATVAIIVALIGVVLAVALRGSGQAQSARVAVGATAPDGTFTTVNGKTLRVSDLRGKPALIWFVSTDCGSCEAGTQAMAANIPRLAQQGVKVAELQLAFDVGTGGPDIATFGHQLAGKRFGQPNWLWGKASEALTTAYDPKGYLDIYYLLDAHGRIAYRNATPDSTMSSLLAAAKKVST